MKALCAVCAGHMEGHCTVLSDYFFFVVFNCVVFNFNCESEALKHYNVKF